VSFSSSRLRVVLSAKESKFFLFLLDTIAGSVLGSVDSFAEGVDEHFLEGLDLSFVDDDAGEHAREPVLSVDHVSSVGVIVPLFRVKAVENFFSLVFAEESSGNISKVFVS